ncbi:protein tyrosine phosphatase receptor type C-associated protein [Emydura macquarii macquarii]|uniref:protein tyrosine phosphatase receptor type C-associated protein n=1 Tax=Emydura macquarii macquarii TaxID=1129001 RepID=UPI00352B6AAF
MHATIHAPLGQLTAGLAFLLLPGAALGTSPESETHSVAVGFLVFLLLLLLLVLALAWRKLSHDSEGRYHPRRLCQPRRLLGAVARRWRALQGEVPPERQWQGKEEEEDDDDEEEEEEELETLQRDEEEGGGGQEQQSQENTDVPEGTPPCDPPEGALEAGGTSGGGLLSDLHSFSGTATWEDSATERGCRQHVTAL